MYSPRPEVPSFSARCIIMPCSELVFSRCPPCLPCPPLAVSTLSSDAEQKTGSLILAGHRSSSRLRDRPCLISWFAIVNIPSDEGVQQKNICFIQEANHPFLAKYYKVRHLSKTVNYNSVCGWRPPKCLSVENELDIQNFFFRKLILVFYL